MVAPVRTARSSERAPHTRILGVMPQWPSGNRDSSTKKTVTVSTNSVCKSPRCSKPCLTAEERDALMAINSRVVLGTITADQLLPTIQPILREVIHHDMSGLVRFTPAPRRISGSNCCPATG